MEVEEKIDKAYDIVVVIPALNEEKGIAPTINSINEVLEGKYKFQILVVDDASTDRTVEIAKSMGAKVIKHRRRGYGDGLQTGFYYVDTKMNSKITVMIDADGTYEPKDIPKMAEIILKEEADFVIGNRFAKMEKKAMTRLNKFGNKVLSFIARSSLQIKVSDTQCGLRAFRTDLSNIFYTSSLGMPFATEMLAATKTHQIKIKEIPTSYYKRIGKAKLTPFQDGLSILGATIRLLRDTRPLALFGLIGFALISLGFFTGIDVLIEYLETGEVVRIASTILSALLIVIGIQSISLALISDMLRIRTHDRRIFYSE